MLMESQFYLKAIPIPIVPMMVLVFDVVDMDTGPLSVMPGATSTVTLFNIPKAALCVFCKLQYT